MGVALAGLFIRSASSLISGLSFEQPAGSILMQIQGPTSVHGPQSINAPHRAQPASPVEKPQGLGQVDQLDISPEADMVSRVSEIPDVRADKVAEIRAQIASGDYESPEKLDAALEQLLNEIY